MSENGLIRNLKCKETSESSTIGKIVFFSIILGHPQQVVKRDIQSLSSYIIHRWPWATLCLTSSSSTTSHSSSCQSQSFTRALRKTRTLGSARRRESISINLLNRCGINWGNVSCCWLYFSFHLLLLLMFLHSSALWCWYWMKIWF